MNTLSEPAVCAQLDRLFADAEHSLPGLQRLLADTPAEEQARLLRSRTDYREVYTRLKDVPLPVSRETGRLLYMLARSCGAHNIVEFGTSFGVSTIHLAAALRDNGGGRIISTEFEPEKVRQAHANLAAAGLAEFVEIRDGDALQTLREDLPECIDLVLLDGAKALYTDILDLLEPRLCNGAWVLADNADWCPDYLARVRAQDGRYLSIACADDIELSMKIR